MANHRIKKTRYMYIIFFSSIELNITVLCTQTTVIFSSIDEKNISDDDDDDGR